jgi:tRNA(Ile)-lysidine synthase
VATPTPKRQINKVFLLLFVHKKKCFRSLKMTLPLRTAFELAMARLGPFGPAPRLAVAVSGGADSTALTLLTHDWITRHGGSMVALIVDHGLRDAAAAEAMATRNRLAQRGIEAEILTLSGLRNARHTVLAQAARGAGAIFVLLGHHQADQAETVAMRAQRGRSGLQGMASRTARNDVVLLRPLLAIAPEILRDFLRAANVAWTEDPSNTDPRFERVRVRLAGAADRPEPPEALQRDQADAADFLARHSSIRAEGFAVIQNDTAPVTALAALLRMVGGADYAPRQDRVAELAGTLRPATLGGVRILRSGKLAGWLLVREVAACAPPVPALQDAVWDRRFRVIAPRAAASLGALGPDAARFRHGSNLPAAVLSTLPCLRLPDGSVELALPAVIFTPPGPAAPHPFIP